MAKAQNTFLGSKMNKDIDARLLRNGDYRDALNVQVSRSEGDGVGSLENVLGNSLAVDFGSLEDVSDLTCIGYFSDDINNNIYLFLTNYTDPSPSNFRYSPTASNFIYVYNTVSKVANKLVEGAFLNFSKTNFIYGVNVLEDFLFWTDNRNQPRKINIISALGSSSYYQTEDQISVSTYNPYQSILLYRQSLLSSSEQYETTMLDVTSKFYPNGGTANSVTGTYTAGTDVPISNIIGNIYINSVLKSSASPGSTILNDTKVTKIDTSVSPPAYIQLDKDITIVSDDLEIVFEPNPYFEKSYNGDPNYLEDRFVRFGYRFNFVDGENSIFSPFTQPAFIPKQDGYFVTNKTDLDTTNVAGNVYASKEINDQKASYQSTIVEFMENKVNKILLYIPLPFNNYDLQNALKVDSIDILYKESNQAAVKVIEQVSIETIFNSSGEAEVTNPVTASQGPFAIENIKGGILVGSQVTFEGSTGSAITVTDFSPTNPAIPTSGNITLSENVTLNAGDIITIGNPRFYIYDYQSRKPFKVLPEKDLIRVYDKTPVRSLAQEIISNRVVYGNFQNKHTPPAFLDYNVSSSPKAEFSVNNGTADSQVPPTGKEPSKITINSGSESGTIWDSGNIIGSIITSKDASIPAGTVVKDYDSFTNTLTLTNNVNYNNGDIIELMPASNTQDATSIIEYPNHSVKQNRNYQVGVVLSDRYGRQSSVILSNSLNTVTTRGVEFKGSTIYSAYNSSSIVQSTWPGDSLKVSFNSPIGPSNKNTSIGWPGLYNGDENSSKYNPLGWYSWKIVVKQTEQEYYNVYLPGVMAAYPKDALLELGRTSHAVLINDNINKIPRDLNEVGPQQKQFRSSVGIFGRVENHVDPAVLNFSENRPYYPGIKPDTVSVISTLNDLFDFSPLVSERPDFFPQFYSYTSNPLIARITTENKIGQINSTNLVTGSGIVDTTKTPAQTGTTPPVVQEDTVTLADIQGTIVSGMSVRGGGLAEGTVVAVASLPTVKLANPAPGSPISVGSAQGQSIFETGTTLTFFDNPQTNPVGIQYLAVYETEPVESLLDIFWETSSSGLISDLNTSILSDTLGAIEIIDFNDALFFEDLAIGSSIINGNGFTVQDIFGTDVDPNDFEITLESQVPGEASIIDQTGADRSTAFVLEETTTPGFYQIKTNELFVFLEDPAIRNFVVNIKVTNTVQQSVTYFIENIELKNKIPTFISCPSTPGYDGENGNTPPNIDISQTETIAINIIEAENGSRFYEDGAVSGQRFLAGQELQFEIIAQLRTSQLQEFGGSFSEQNVFDQVYTDPVTGYTIENIGQTGPFTLNTTIATSDSINSGVSFCTLEKPDPASPSFSFVTTAGGTSLAFEDFQDWAIWLKVIDANGSFDSLETQQPYCRAIVRINRINVEKAWGWNFITPRDLAVGGDVYKDGTCTVAEVLDGNIFRTENLLGDNAFFPNGVTSGIFDPNVIAGVPRGPIFVQPTDGNTSNPANGDEIYQTSGGFSTAPNSIILDSNDNPTVRVSSVDYTNAGPPFSNDFGTDAIITTFESHGLSVGDVISFSSGRWLVTVPNAAGDVFTTPVFPRMRIAGQFPYYSPINPNQPATYQELCAQVTNAFPQKTAVINRNCDFESYPVEQEDVTPYNPFTTFSFGQQMVSSGQVGSGTISSCQENCTPGT